MKRLAIIKYTISIIILGLLLVTIKPSKILAVLNLINLKLILIIIILAFALILLTTINLKIFISPYIKKISFIEFFKKYLVTWSISSFTPGKIGDRSLSYLLKDKISPEESIAALILDKLITLIVLSVIGIIGVFYILPKEYAYLVTISLIFIIGLVVYFINSKKIKNYIANKFFKKYTIQIENFEKTIKEYIRNHKKLIIINAIITLIIWTTSSSIIYISLHLFNQEIPFITTVFITCLGNLSFLVPITINGLGLREAINIFFFEKYFIPKEFTLTIFLLITVLNYLFAFIFIQLFMTEKT